MSMKSLKVTILMPIYKVEQYLEKTLTSVFTQTYNNIDYVFVNDCSPDNSLKVLTDTISKFGIASERYVIVNHQHNEGIAVSRSDCIAKATGDYVYFVDSDDWVEPDAVEKMVEASLGGTVDLVGCDFAKDFLSGEVTFHHENYSTSCRENLLKCLNYEIGTVLWKILIRRSLFNHITIKPHIDIVEDYIISIKLYYYAHNFVSIPQAFYHYVQYNQARVSLQTLWSVRMHIEGVKEIEAFCREKGLYDDYVEQQLNLRKFNIKSNFLTKHLLDYDASKNTFPEASHVWIKMGYSRKERLKFWLAEYGMFPLLKFIQR